MRNVDILIKIATNKPGTEAACAASKLLIRHVRRKGMPVLVSGLDFALKRDRLVYVEARVGTSIFEVGPRLGEEAERLKKHILTSWNGTGILFPPDRRRAARVIRGYAALGDERSAKYRRSQEGLLAGLRAKEAAEAKLTAYKEAMTHTKAEPDMSGDPEYWAGAVAAQESAYGKRVVEYASDWARLMEVAVENGASVVECAERLSAVADCDGITGFMFYTARRILIRCWVYGPLLKEAEVMC